MLLKCQRYVVTSSVVIHIQTQNHVDVHKYIIYSINEHEKCKMETRIWLNIKMLHQSFPESSLQSKLKEPNV